MKRQNVRTLSLIVCTFTYLLIGAAVFDALESEYEVENKRRLLEEEGEILTRYNISDKDFNAIRHNVIWSRPYQEVTQWKFGGALYLSLVVVAAIGYGHSTPKTVGGKLFCMSYALAGIPLCMIMFQSVGERLNTFVTFALRQIKKCFRLRNTEVSQSDLIFITMNLSTMILTCGALVFSHVEGWAYIDAFYYSFITLTTIGFGDFVALQQDNMVQSKPHYFVFSILFILFGLTVISAAMNLLVLRFLTMNTADELRDEREAAVAARNAVHLEGDVITGNNGVVSNLQEQPTGPIVEDSLSVCSCSCYKWRSPRDKVYSTSPMANQMRKKFRSKGMNNQEYSKEVDSTLSEDTDSFINWQRDKRASL
ncbi:two pore potassium channel protein sup-9-like [Ylistrum balloti]|uniref:two pore potassium channel protein sup-9-like n=1 Tax=Ylistrum balloti TaxID=509963 RepID=UPI002905EE60|nr:two pore potassium channel protein sup-9-like [Ylistrum balloti]